MLRRSAILSSAVTAALLLAGCPKGNTDYDAGKKAASVQDYDTALVDFDRALRAEPTNPEYKLRVTQAKFDASQQHMDRGRQASKNGDLQLALAEFQRAQALDPSNSAADQEVKRTMEALSARDAATQQTTNVAPPQDEQILSRPPELKPISTELINLKMTNDARVVFDTIAKMAGVSVVFDPDFTSRRITAELPNVTLEQALETVCLETKSFWKPITPSVIFIAPDQPQKRKDLEDEEVQTFYLSNTLTPQDLTEVVNGFAAAAGPAPVTAGELAERDRDPRHAGQAGGGGEDYSRHRQGQTGSFDSRAGDDGEHGPFARPGNFAGADGGFGVHAARIDRADQYE